MVVLDASAVIAWAHADEAGLPDQVIDYVTANIAAVPTHWMLEVTNTLVVSERSGRLDSTQRQEFLANIESLPIRVDPETPIRGWHAIPALAKRYRLTTYDAAYLELALRLNVPLVTLDQNLARAARAAKVPLFS